MGTPDTVCESLSVPYRDTIFMKEVIKKVRSIGEGLVADLRGVFMFLMLQNQLPRCPKPGCCGWRLGWADVSWEQKCGGSILRATPWGAVPLPVPHALSRLRQTCLAKCLFT